MSGGHGRWTSEPRARGCDHWTGAYYCGEAHTVTDEVTDEVFCPQHAGPLAWDDRHVNLYSLALKTSAQLGVVYQMPEALASVLYPPERAA